MGIDGIEFLPDYHQNLGTIQEVWIFQNFCCCFKLTPPPWSNHILKYNRKSIFSKPQGVEVSPSNEHNNLWGCVVQVGSVEKSIKKKHENRQSYQNSEK